MEATLLPLGAAGLNSGRSHKDHQMQNTDPLAELRRVAGADSPDAPRSTGASRRPPMSTNDDPLAELRRLAETGAPESPQTDSVPRQTSGGSRTRARLRQDPELERSIRESSRFSGFMTGFADTLTFGYADEIAAAADTYLPTWFGGREGNATYEENLARTRAWMEGVGDLHYYTSTAGMVLGGFVPFAGWTARGAQAARAAGATRTLGGTALNMARTGAWQGALYGSGSADGDIYDRLRNAALGGTFGAAGGYVLGATIVPLARVAGEKITAFVTRQGRTPRFDNFEFHGAPRASQEVAEELRDVTAEVIPQRVRRGSEEALPETPRNILTGQADDVLEDGAILSTRELFGAPEAARRLILERVSKMTDQQAQRWATRLEDAELDGNLADPHYRSLLGINLEGRTDIDEQTMLQAAELLEEATEAVLEKAGTRTRSGRQTDEEMRRLYGKTVTEKEIDEAVERMGRATTDGRVGRHLMALAGLQFIRAKDRLLPQITLGNKEARAELSDELTRAIRLSAKGRTIVSSIGRALGDMSKAQRLAFTEVVDDTIQIESAASIKARVEQSLRELGDTDLAALISQMRTMDDLGKVEEILLNADAAKHFSNWRKTFNSLGLFIKSNSLTPASGVFNTIGFIAHDFFRNNLAKRWAARGFQMSGKADEALKLRFEVAVSNAVYWDAHKRGLRAMMHRLKWEALDSVEKIAGVGYGSGKVALRASASKNAMLRAGYAAPEVREFDQAGRAAVTNLSAFNGKLERYRTEGGALSTLLYHANRVGAVALNTVDAVGTATARVVSGALDDWGRNFVKVKEAYALSARHAMNEAMELASKHGLSEDEMISYAQRRSAELAEMPPTEVLEKVEQKLLAREELGDDLKMILERELDVEKEASRVLFMDGPQTSAGRTFANAADRLDRAVSLGTTRGVLMTYIKTPTRIFERGIVSYTPWGKHADEVKAILARGGVEAEIEKARMELGGFLMGAGASLAAAGAFTVTNGGWKNSANLENAPPNRINLPGGISVEIGRLDPFALTLAFGGIIGQAANAYRDANHEYEATEALHTAAQIGYLALRDAFFEKSYMTGVRDLMRSVFSDGDGFLKGYEKIVQSAFTRSIPLAGTSRMVNDTIRSSAPEAIGWVDNILRSVPGGGLYLPSRIDALGDEVDGRDFGIAIGRKDGGGAEDPVRQQLADLGIDINNLDKRDPEGFHLTSEELSELRRIRGHEAVNSDGATMREALGELFADPWFQNLPTREQKQEAVVEVMGEFNDEARAIFEERNPQYLSDRTANRAFIDYMNEGLTTRSEARQEALWEAEDMGLPAPTRLPN